MDEMDDDGEKRKSSTGITSSLPTDVLPTGNPSNSEGDVILNEDHGIGEGSVSFKEILMGKSTNEMKSIEENDKIQIADEDIEIRHEENEIYFNFSDKLEGALSNKMKNTVIVRLLGGNLGYHELCTKIQSLWKPKGRYRIIDMDKNYFAVRFNEHGDYLHALLDGPWMARGLYLIVQPWNPAFSSTRNEVLMIMAWVRLPGLPLHYYNQDILRKIGSQLGQVLKLDFNTSFGNRGKFARMAIELDLTKPLRSRIFLNGNEQKILYEGIPVICSSCNKFGHNSDGCSLNANQQHMEGVSQEGQDNIMSHPTQLPSNEGWKTVAPNHKRKSPHNKQLAKTTKNSVVNSKKDGTRFSVLMERENINEEEVSALIQLEGPKDDTCKEGLLGNVIPPTSESQLHHNSTLSSNNDSIIRETNENLNSQPLKERSPKVSFEVGSSSSILHDGQKSENLSLPEPIPVEISSFLDPTKHTAIRFDLKGWNSKKKRSPEKEGWSLRGSGKKTGVTKSRKSQMTPVFIDSLKNLVSAQEGFKS